MKKIIYICDMCSACEETRDGIPTPDWFPAIWVKVGEGDHPAFEASYNLCHQCRVKLVDSLRFGPAAPDAEAASDSGYEAAVQQRYLDQNRLRGVRPLGRGHGG